MSQRATGLWLLLALLLVAAWQLPPIAQPRDYHRFADQATCLGIPHCHDTLSNLLFIPAGLAGLVFLGSAPARRGFIDQRAKAPYALFFLAIVMVGLASAYYHLAPDNRRLVWDRAAIAVAMMSWFAAVLGERIGTARRSVVLVLPVLVLAGLASVGYWKWSESIGQGDLRAYALMQLLPMLFVPLLLWLYPPRYSGDRDILIVLGLYALALLCDLKDRSIADLTGHVSGHTLKHVLASGAAGWVILGLRRRTPLRGQVLSRRHPR